MKNKRYFSFIQVAENYFYEKVLAVEASICYKMACKAYKAACKYYIAASKSYKAITNKYKAACKSFKAIMNRFPSLSKLLKSSRKSYKSTCKTHKSPSIEKIIVFSTKKEAIHAFSESYQHALLVINIKKYISPEFQ